MDAHRLHRNRKLGTILLTALITPMFVGCGPTSFLVTPVSVDRSLKERVLLKGEGWAPPKIALIDIDGILLNARNDGFFSQGEQPVALLLEKLHKAQKDDRVKAVILRINSPGGSVTASALMYHEIRKFAQTTEKPVIAVFMDVAASGAYYLACACDEIIAHKSTVTGSIGVIMQMFNVTGTMHKLGVTADAIKSGPNKDAGSPFRQMSPDERAIFQTLVDQFYEEFLKVVATGRSHLDPAEIRELADGRVFSAQQALELGLIDRIGTMDDAVQICLDRTGLETASLIAYHRPRGWKPNIYAAAPDNPARSDGKLTLALPRWMTGPAPRFMYLWAPGW